MSRPNTAELRGHLESHKGYLKQDSATQTTDTFLTPLADIKLSFDALASFAEKLGGGLSS
jgi:hypothetical protein